MAFIKEESEDVKIEETIRVKHEDSDDDGLDLMAIIEEIQKQHKKQEQEQEQEQCAKHNDFSTGEKTEETPPPAKAKEKPIRRRLICSECGNTFSNRSGLRMHMMIHTGEKPFTCHQCGKRFVQRGNFQTHMKVHTREKPYSCNLCGKSVTTKQKLNNHMNLHVSDRWKECKKKSTQSKRKKK
ncbi:gastrula zinc finger protein XlCGF49.1 [Carassius gibelio]|uniref:gastrula zinc finger protein XlCGF49.1 n=1 Tax=Carassius gibelio TaxID=101364 RepID=UPI0022780FAA|nr:gastrula zinc finger protein XlCGF49.1 [Carassius gibelio]